MKNIQMEVKGNNLIITVDLTQDHGPSKSGKTIAVAQHPWQCERAWRRI